MEPTLKKARLRKQLLAERRSLDSERWRHDSARLCENLRSLPLFQRARTVLAYFSCHQEPDLNSLFTPGHRWGMSRCEGDSLTWHLWTAGDPVALNRYGIKEPLPGARVLLPGEVDLLLIPSVACDRRGYRLGYGGGYFDRLLAGEGWRDVPTLGILFDRFYLEELPIDPWDKPLEGICTELRVQIFSP